MAGKSLKKTSSNELSKVVETIEAENVVKVQEDIEVADDGYVHDVPLLAGYIDPETGILHNTFTYRETNGKDEEALSKADVKSNGAKYVNILVERCVSSIGTLTRKELGTTKWNQIIKSLLGGDLDYMAFKIRELSKGKEVKFSHVCPRCGAKLNTLVMTDEFDVIPFKGEREIAFTLPRGYKDKAGVIHKEGVIHLLNGEDREIVVPIIKKNTSTANSMLITRTVKFNDNAIVTQPMVSEMATRDRDYLLDIISENVFGVDMSFEITCDSCGADLSGDANQQSNFF